MFVLRTRDGNFHKRGPTAKNPLWITDLDAEPSPAILAKGIRNCYVSGHEIEYDGTPPPMTDLSKPPYRIPLMTEVAAIPWNGLTVISTFAGCGGSSTGYRMAGYRVLLASEFVPIAQDSYRANMGPHTVLAPEDVKELTGAMILERTGLKAGELDVLDGSPPCQAFSTAGRREKGWGTDKRYEHGATQRNEDLFDEYVRLVGELRPRVFVAENVSGLVKGVAKGHFLKILAALKACGYRVEAKLLDAQWLGVPQTRQRIIFVGVREDLGLAPAFPEPLPYRYSVRDALPWITRAVHDRGVPAQGAKEFAGSASPTITVGHANYGHFQVEAETDISRYAIGAEYDRLNPGQQSDKYFSLVRADPDHPSPAITAIGGGSSVAGVVHPTEKRKFTIAEVRRLCGFPDDFQLVGTYGQQWERLGNSVPPVMMAAVAAAVRDAVLLPARAAGTGRSKPRGPSKPRAGFPPGSGALPSPAAGSRRPGRAAPSGGRARASSLTVEEARRNVVPPPNRSATTSERTRPSPPAKPPAGEPAPARAKRIAPARRSGGHSKTGRPPKGGGR